MSYCKNCTEPDGAGGGGDCLRCMVNAGDQECEHALYMDISRQVRELVDALLVGVDDPANEEIRQRLNETFRFWRY